MAGSMATIADPSIGAARSDLRLIAAGLSEEDVCGQVAAFLPLRD